MQELFQNLEQLLHKIEHLVWEARRTRVTVQYEIEEFSNEDAEWILEEAEGFVLQVVAFAPDLAHREISSTVT